MNWFRSLFAPRVTTAYTINTRPMTAEEIGHFHEAFDQMDKAFSKLDQAFRNMK